MDNSNQGGARETTELEKGRLSVLHLLRWLTATGGGIRTYMASVASALSSVPIDISAGALEFGDPPAYIPNALHRGIAGASAVGNAFRFWRWALRAVKGADVVHIHSVFGWIFVLGAPACLLRGIPFVVCPHVEFEPWAMTQSTLKKRIFLSVFALPILRRSAGLIATTRANAEAIAVVAPGVPIHLVVPGISVSPLPSALFHCQPDHEVELRVLYVGRIEALKDLPYLVQAMSLLQERVAGARLDIVGTGPEALVAGLRDLARSLGLDDLITFHGYRDGADKLAIMRSAHVMCIPSPAENFSFATAEALALGLPAVVTTGVALCHDIKEHDCGSVVAPADPQALANALAAYSDPATRRIRGLKGHQFALNSLSLTAMGTGLRQLYFVAAGSQPKLRNNL